MKEPSTQTAIEQTFFFKQLYDPSPKHLGEV
jgi:hypothetical protein